MKAQHAANQAYLDELRAPQPPEELEEIFAFVVRSAPLQRVPPAKVEEEKNTLKRCTTSEELVSSVVKTWQLYWQQERDGQRQDARSTLLRLVAPTPPDSHTPTPLLSLSARLTLAKSYQQEGIHFRALTVFDQTEAELSKVELLSLETSPSLHYFFSTAITYGRALSYFRRGQYDLAAQHFAKVTAFPHNASGLALNSEPRTLNPPAGQADPRTPNPPAGQPEPRTLNPDTPTPLLPPASYRLAQCLEFQGEFAKASETYAALAKAPATPLDLRRLSAFALRRLEQARSAGFSRSSSGADRDRKAIYLGENRSDMGEWKYNHPGTQALILCAMQCPFDVIAGPGEKPRASAGAQSFPLNYRLSTSDPKEKCRRWISRLEDPSPSALWDPIRHAFTSSNWDDFGEQYPVGQGPDLIVDLGIPAGGWRLSLSFINDHNYYEPNRAYTVYLKDAEGRFLAGCDVEGHLCGVYKHFAVFGPQELRVYVSRDLSLNTVLSGIFLDPLAKPPAVPDELSMRPEEPDAASGGDVSALKQAYDRLAVSLERPTTESAGWVPSIWTVMDLAEKCVPPVVVKAAGRSGSSGDPKVGQSSEDPAESLRTSTDPAPYPSWVRWQALRLAAVSAAEEGAALEGLSQSMAARLGLEQSLTRLAGLRNQCLAAGEVGRAELLEDQRLELALPKLSNVDRETALRDAAFRFYALDHAYAESKLRPVVETMAADPDPAKRAERLQALSKACREQKAWSLAQMVYETIESNVPLKNRGDEHFRHYFRSLEYQGKPKEAVAILQQHLKDLPDSGWDILWRLNLVSHLLATGQVDEAVEANTLLLKKHPKHSSVDNLEFLIGLKLFQVKKDRTAARERFVWVIRNFPNSYWATSSQRMLKQMGEKVPD
jgi:tetratricopeptide (TPR) repeat protein